MKLFQHSKGFVFAFGFDMVARKPNPRVIGWCDPGSGQWEIAPTNLAGWTAMAYAVDPEFIRESDGKIVAYQPGKCIEIDYVGAPYVWSVRTLLAEPAGLHRAA